MESGAELALKKEEIRTALARAGETQFAKLSCGERAQLNFVRACQGAVMSGPDPHTTSDYVHSYCSGGADSFVLTSRIEWPILPGGESVECPDAKAKETGSELGTQLKSRLMSRW